MLMANVSAELEVVQLMMSLSWFTMKLLVKGTLLPSISKTQSHWLDVISKWALNFGVVLRSPDFQILPEAKGDIPRQHNLPFYYPNLHSFFQVLLSLRIFELPSAHLSLTNQQGMCQFVMPNCWGCVPAIVLPAAEPALPCPPCTPKTCGAKTSRASLTQTQMTKYVPWILL